MEISKVGEMLRIFNSSLDFKAIIKMLDFFVDFTIIQPIHAEKLEEDDADLLEAFFIDKVCIIFVARHGKHIPDLSDAIRTFFPQFDKSSESFQFNVIFVAYSEKIWFGNFRKCKGGQSSSIVFNDVVT